LKELKLATHKEREADMLQMYKIASGVVQLDGAGWFEPPPLAVARTRRYADNPQCAPQPQAVGEAAEFFAVRAGKQWNDFPASIRRTHCGRLQTSICTPQGGNFFYFFFIAT
jgi:hypothetical protein